MVSAAVLLALAAAAPPAEIPSILVPERYVLKDVLHEIPTAWSPHYLLENVAQPVVYQIEESGGFSDPDPAKFSIYGDSWVWNRWTWDGFDLTDPLEPGAAALQVPFPLLGDMHLRYRETATEVRDQGVGLRTGWSRAPRAQVMLVQPHMGGIWPLARPIMDLLSGKHARDRSRAPPEVRRRFRDAFELALMGEARPAGTRLRYALHAQQGSRRFLDFGVEGEPAEPYDTDFTVVNGATVWRTGTSTVWVAAEHRQRSHRFVELYAARREAEREDKSTLFLGWKNRGLQVGLTVQRRDTRPVDADFTRELLDPDGELRFPFRPTGTAGSASLDVAYRAPGGQGLFAHGVARSVWLTPRVDRRAHPVTVDGAPYGTWAFTSRTAAQLYGDARVGWIEAVDLGRVRMTAQLYGFSTWGANGAGRNGLALFDAGAKVQLTPRRPSGFRPFLTLARTPVALDLGLVRALDPEYDTGRLTLRDGRLLETTGGDSVTVDPGLSATDVYSGAAGFAWQTSERGRFELLGILKAYRDTFRLDYDGGPDRYGATVDGVFYLNDGPTRYRLVNENDEIALSFGLHLQYHLHDPENYLFTVGFSAFNAVGEAPFGNGPNANDLGVVRFDGANPNSRVNDLANLDSDRGFAVKAMAGYRFWDTLWGLATVRFRDGTPFSFFTPHERDGQVAFTYHSKRGSPLKLQRPLDGPREDFHFNLDLMVRYDTTLGGLPIRAWAHATNVLDFGNEIQEVSGEAGISGRVALETQIPRALLIGVELSEAIATVASSSDGGRSGE